MSTTALDQKVDELTRRLTDLPPDAIAVFSAGCAERLSPFYEFFSLERQWGDYSLLRGLLDMLWEFLSGHRTLADELCRSLALIEPLIPHSDDFPGLSCIGAQDFGICLDSGIRWSQRMPSAGPHAAQYAMEILRAAAALTQTGHSWLGDTPERGSVDGRLLRHPLIVCEIKTQEAELNRLISGVTIASELVKNVRQDAVAGRYDARAILTS